MMPHCRLTFYKGHCSLRCWLPTAISRQIPLNLLLLSPAENGDKAATCNQNTETLEVVEGTFGTNKLQQFLNVTTCRHHQLWPKLRSLPRMPFSPVASLMAFDKSKFTLKEYFNCQICPRIPGDNFFFLHSQLKAYIFIFHFFVIV